nr:PREDICTED: cytochrome P450 2C41-like [Anolis carolinensis]|eukprot:XP_016851489.1 PREDICTED: cytochrome P450 2C41-like [Anolis carolinensis]
MEPLGTSTVLLVICISCLLLSAFWKSQANKRKMPPGPPPLPIIRKALRLKTNHLDLTLCKLSKSYGPIFTLYFGPRPVVVLHGYGTVKEALIERADEFAARGRMPSMEKYVQGKGTLQCLRACLRAQMGARRTLP